MVKQRVHMYTTRVTEFLLLLYSSRVSQAQPQAERSALFFIFAFLFFQFSLITPPRDEAEIPHAVLHRTTELFVQCCDRHKQLSIKLLCSMPLLALELLRASGAQPLVFGHLGQIDAKTMKPFDWTFLVVARDHAAKCHSSACAVDRFVRVDAGWRWGLVNHFVGRDAPSLSPRCGCLLERLRGGNGRSVQLDGRFEDLELLVHQLHVLVNQVVVS